MLYEATLLPASPWQSHNALHFFAAPALWCSRRPWQSTPAPPSAAAEQTSLHAAAARRAGGQADDHYPQCSQSEEVHAVPGARGGSASEALCPLPSGRLRALCVSLSTLCLLACLEQDSTPNLSGIAMQQQLVGARHALTGSCTTLQAVLAEQDVCLKLASGSQQHRKSRTMDTSGDFGHFVIQRIWS